jgi:hypothetical protein
LYKLITFFKHEWWTNSGVFGSNSLWFKGCENCSTISTLQGGAEHEGDVGIWMVTGLDFIEPSIALNSEDSKEVTDICTGDEL